MKTIFQWTLLLLLATLWTGCTDEIEIANAPATGGETHLSITIPLTRAGQTYADEGYFSHLRMLIFATNSAAHENGALVTNLALPTAAGATEAVFSTIVPRGLMHIYFVGNEDPAWDLSAVGTIAQLKQKVQTFDAYPDPRGRGFVLFSEYKSVYLGDDNVPHYSGPNYWRWNSTLMRLEAHVERTVAKVSFELTCRYTDLQIQLDDISIRRMPIRSWLQPQAYTLSQMLQGDVLPFIEGDNVSTDADGFGTNVTCYVPEYHLTDVNQYTYAHLRGHHIADPSRKVEYLIAIGEGIASKTNDELLDNRFINLPDLTVKRNTHYRFTGAIKTTGLHLVAEVKNWIPASVTGNALMPYLNLSTLSTTVYDGAVSRIYFWSNQPASAISVLPGGLTAGGAHLDVNATFDRLTGAGAANLHYNQTTGEGYIDLAQLNAANVAGSKIYLSANGVKREITVDRILTSQAAKNIATTYVGTFHRWNERGERVVTWNLAAGTTWNARVEGDAAVVNEVLIDRLPSPAFALAGNATLYGSAPAGPELFPVSDSGNAAHGTGRVYFRIGWKSDATPTTNRYAKVVVRAGHTVGAGAVLQTLYLRQGEAADYVMRPTGDPIASIGSVDRPSALRISPYNLTATTFSVALAFNGGIFTQYPTQPGAFFQWSSTNRRRYAYDANSNSPANWTGAVNEARYWDAILDAEVCPPGYHRPNDGITNAAHIAGIANSEFRQSFLSAPDAASGNATSNSRFGMYADGFYDRLSLNGTIGNNNTAAPVAASVGTTDIALVGRLFYNPTTYAAIFIPAAGFRNPLNGALSRSGQFGYLWTSSAANTSEGSRIYTSSGSASMAGHSREGGLNIRCCR